MKLAAAAALAALLGVGGGASPRAHAADGTWNGLADDSQWANTANWVDGIIAGNNSGASGTSTDTATFVSNPPPPVTDPPTEWAVVNVDPDRNIRNLTFASTTITFRIGTNTFNEGNPLYLSGGGLAQATGNTVGINSDIHAPVQFTGSTYTFKNDSLANATLRFQGNITAAPGGTTLTLDGAHGAQASSQTELNGALLDNPTGGALSIIKQGTGVWEVNADSGRPSTYSGDTIINGGILRSTTGSGTNGLGAFSPNSHYIVNSGGTLRNSTIGTTMGRLTVNAGGIVNGSNANATLLNIATENAPAVTLNFTASASTDITLGLPIGLTGTTADHGGVTLLATPGATGTGRVTFGSSTGFFNMGEARRIFDIGKGVGADYDLRIQGQINGSGGFIKTGPGTLRFSGPATSPMTGDIEVREGTFNPSVANLFDNRPALLVNGGTLHVQGDQTQTLGAVTVTKGALTGGNNNSTLAAPSFTFNVGAGDTALADVILADSGGPTSLTKSGAGSATIEIAPTYTGPTNVSGGTLSFATSATGLSAVNITGGTLQVRPSNTDTGRVIKTGSLSITGDGRLDLTRHKLITDTPVGTFTAGAYSGVHGDVARAYHSGAWDRPGLMTSETNAGPTVGTTTIGVASASQILFIAPTATGTWAGQPVTGTTTLAMYTYAGDLNFDGRVDAQDYGIIDNWVQFPGTNGYANGDINYDGVIDAADYGIIDNTIQLQGPPIPTGAWAGATLSGVTAVPEPSAWGFAIAAAVAGLARRGRRRRAVATALPDSATSTCGAAVGSGRSPSSIAAFDQTPE